MTSLAPEAKGAEKLVFSLEETVSLLERLRARGPRVHCITNSVAQNFTANVLLALGAVPSMTVAREEISDFVKSAEGFLVNIGTIDDERRAAIDLGLDAVEDAGLAFVLDPVLVNRSPARLKLAKSCMARRPAVVRANADEVAALSGGDTPEDFAKNAGVTLALTGAVDRVTDGRRAMDIASGHPLMARVTAMGCAASAVVAGFLCVEDDPLKAAAAALTVVGLAGEEAGERSQGPGSFVPAFLDALYRLGREGGAK
ncbi:hydroxyethylthiazole kinase [Stappia sp. GBMRC 2046]|uniref:Hydroxyethylthiazole kinase n=1 Tax=Stappia sediminis TaxID=2692190 RepID=A0A7X3LRB5_9HYPH|nr:hydroxyethylthiazole kinase [Stappia sediminis]MXN63663.1 hydroxyethylthiazole kinase [Stappia sediminis]